MEGQHQQRKAVLWKGKRLTELCVMASHFRTARIRVTARQNSQYSGQALKVVASVVRLTETVSPESGRVQKTAYAVRFS